MAHGDEKEEGGDEGDVLFGAVVVDEWADILVFVFGFD